jgi:hypothetical protein
MSLKTKIARYAATQKAGLPIQVETLIRQIGSTDFNRADLSAVFCTPEFNAWHVMTKRKIIYKIIFPTAAEIEADPNRRQQIIFRSSTSTVMLSEMGIDGGTCPDCAGNGTKINKSDVDQFIEKCHRCAGIGFIENPPDEIQIHRPPTPAKPPSPAPAAAPVEKPGPQEPEPVTKPEAKPVAMGAISNFLQDVKRGFMPISHDLINKKCAGKDVTKGTLIEAIIDAFIDAIIDAEAKEG